MIHRNDPAALEWLHEHRYAISNMNAYVGAMFSIKEDTELHPSGKSQFCWICSRTGDTRAQLYSSGPMTEAQEGLWMTGRYLCRRGNGELA